MGDGIMQCRFQRGKWVVRFLAVLIFLQSSQVFAVADGGGDSLKGAELYRRHCASCHRDLDRTFLFDRTSSRIRSAIEQVPAMVTLRDLTDKDLSALADVLSTTPVSDE